MASTTLSSEGDLFGGFPVELLATIKSHIPLSDLRTHICFYLTCRTTASMYGTPEDEEAFWKKSCALSGIGLTPRDVKNQLTWRKVAFDCIARDGFCSHPQCGGVLLDWNAEQIARISLECPQWDPTKGPVLAKCQSEKGVSGTNGHDSDSSEDGCNAYYSGLINSLNQYNEHQEHNHQYNSKASQYDDTDSVADNEPDTTCVEKITKIKNKGPSISDTPVTFSPIFGHLGFQSDHPPANEDEEAFLRDPKDKLKHSRLHNHPITARSFAMFPMYSHLKTAMLSALDTDDHATTVWDVQKDIANRLNCGLDDYLLRCFFAVKTIEPLPRRTMREVWSRSRWTLTPSADDTSPVLRAYGPTADVNFDIDIDAFDTLVLASPRRCM